MATVETRRLTYEDFRELPTLPGRRYELIGGELYVTPSPSLNHQAVVGNLYVALRRLIDERGLGKIFLAPLDIVFSKEDALQPDLLFVRNARVSILARNYVKGAPDLVIEVLSPTTAEYDRDIKRRLYAAAGVSEVWYVDPRAASIELLRLEAAGSYSIAGRFSGDDVLVSPTFPGFELPLSVVFQ